VTAGNNLLFEDVVEAKENNISSPNTAYIWDAEHIIWYRINYSFN